MKEAENNNIFSYNPVQSNKGTTNEDDDDNFADAYEPPKQMAAFQTKQTSAGLPPAATNKVVFKKDTYEYTYFFFNETLSQVQNHQ